MYQCNKCYYEPTNQEGCFTNDVSTLIKDKIPPCLDGTWQSFNPCFIKVELQEVDQCITNLN
jgi:hypothetical protein